MSRWALSLTPEREAVMDFRHAFYSTGLAIATPAQWLGWLGVVKQLLSPAFLSAVGVLALLLLAQTRVTEWQETFNRYLGQR